LHRIQGIIEKPTAVFAPKNLGQLRIRVDYTELNKHTTKDSHPLPLPDEVQD